MVAFCEGEGEGVVGCGDDDEDEDGVGDPPIWFLIVIFSVGLRPTMSLRLAICAFCSSSSGVATAAGPPALKLHCERMMRSR